MVVVVVVVVVVANDVESFRQARDKEKLVIFEYLLPTSDAAFDPAA